MKIQSYVFCNECKNTFFMEEETPVCDNCNRETEMHIIPMCVADEISSLREKVFSQWYNTKKTQPNIGDRCLVVADGKIYSAVYDYWCPVSSEERVDKWEIYRYENRIVYLEYPVTRWAPASGLLP